MQLVALICIRVVSNNRTHRMTINIWFRGLQLWAWFNYGCCTSDNLMSGSCCLLSFRLIHILLLAFKIVWLLQLCFLRISFLLYTVLTYMWWVRHSLSLVWKEYSISYFDYYLSLSASSIAVFKHRHYQETDYATHATFIDRYKWHVLL